MKTIAALLRLFLVCIQILILFSLTIGVGAQIKQIDNDQFYVEAKEAQQSKFAKVEFIKREKHPYIESKRREFLEEGKQIILKKLGEKKEETCELTFRSNNSGMVTPPDWFVKRLKNYNCRQKQLLTRLGFYESTWRDICNKYGYCGYYQFGKAAIQECKNNGRYKSQEDCALYHVKVNYKRFEAITRNLNSFKDLI